MGMSKRRSEPVSSAEDRGPPPPPLWAEALLERGDNVALAREARRRLEDPKTSKDEKEAARRILKDLAFDPVALAFFGVGLVVWCVAFTLGVLLR
jgi:hypothetical protein